MTEDTEEILRDIRRWVKIIGIQEARDIMVDALSAEEGQEQEDLRLVYHLSDGEHSTRDIREIVSFGRKKIMRKQKQWASMGLLEKEHSRAPYEHVITLKEAGLKVPEIPEPEEEAKESTESAEEDTEEELEEELVEESELTDYE